MAAVERNSLKRRGVGLIASDSGRAFPGFTLFAPFFVESRTVYLIDLQRKVVHSWNMPYSPGLSGYLIERGTLYYNGRSPENNPLSRFPFKGGVALEADWDRQGALSDHHDVDVWRRALSDTSQDLIAYINRHLEVKIPEGYKVDFIDYDWTVNDSRKVSPPNQGEDARSAPITFAT